MSDHQSIGEVLTALRGEFPDITISKIRFLESQGLIDPERTPSGYRKFRVTDVARLRWILQQQKDNFLPLKVIKTRLDEVGPDGLPEDIEPGPDDVTAAAEPAASATSAVSTASAPARAKPARAPRATKSTKPKPAKAATKRSAAGTPPEVALPAFESPMLPLDDGEPDDLGIAASGASLTRAEIANAAGLTPAQFAELEEYGLLAPVAGSGDRVVFDEQAMVVAQLCAAFAQHGVGPRHLRMFRAFAEREAGLYDQVIAPRLLRKNPEARAKAREDLVDLVRLGRSLRAAFLRGSVASLFQD